MNFLSACGIDSVRDRLKFVIPENVNRFPSHISLASLLLYSPRALRKIKRFIGSERAYILPDDMGHEDKVLAIQLGIPVLASAPDVRSTLSSQSGSKRVFRDSQINLQPCLLDVFGKQELLVGLAKLMGANIEVDTWHIKLEDESYGHGTAVINAAAVPVIKALRKEKKIKKGVNGYWSRPEVQENAK